MSRKTLQSFVFILLVTIIFTGCASMFGNDKSVELNTNPANSTAIVYDRKGTEIERITTPNKITFKKTGNYTVEFNIDDYLPETISIKKKFNHSFWLNFLVSGIGVSTVMIFDPHFEFQRNNYYAFAGYGLSAIGIVGVLYDIFSGSLVGLSPEKANINLRLTPEATARREAERQETLARQEAQRQAEAEEREAKRQAEALERQRAEDERRKVIEEVNNRLRETRTFNALGLSTLEARASYLHLSTSQQRLFETYITGNILQTSPADFGNQMRNVVWEMERVMFEIMVAYGMEFSGQVMQMTYPRLWTMYLNAPGLRRAWGADFFSE